MRFDSDKEKEFIYIWGDEVPGNTGADKHDVMNWDDSMSMKDMFETYPGVWDRENEKLGDMIGNDTMVYREEIKGGYANETYDDKPFLVPYLVPGSDKCVIACPGGAYLTKSIAAEGSHIAKFLNDAGISCFVLWYRSYPYRAPYMFLDLQRAIRFLRRNADKYGINPAKITTVGFSAGGNLCSVEATVMRNRPVTDFVPDYKPDNVDEEDGMPNAVGLVYPAVTFAGDKIQAVMDSKEGYNDPVRNREFAAKYETKDYIKAGDPPYFLCNALDDEVIDSFLMIEFSKALRKKNVPQELHIFPYGGHGFGACDLKTIPPIPGFKEPDYAAVSQWMKLFVTWLEGTL